MLLLPIHATFWPVSLPVLPPLHLHCYAAWQQALRSDSAPEGAKWPAGQQVKRQPTSTQHEPLFLSWEWVLCRCKFTKFRQGSAAKPNSEHPTWLNSGMKSDDTHAYTHLAKVKRWRSAKHKVSCSRSVWLMKSAHFDTFLFKNNCSYASTGPNWWQTLWPIPYHANVAGYNELRSI